MALNGIKVLEFAGLAPAPFCGKILADFGATVTRIDKVLENQMDVLNHGKHTIALNLKHAKGQNIAQKLAATHDVIIEPFRPGVMEKLNLGPEILCRYNPRLIYARLTGFGQNGRLSSRAGHDINYVAISGVLSMLGRYNDRPQPPINVLADFAGGGLMCALGICLALLERHKSNQGQVIDAAMVEGAAYIASWLFMSRSLPIWLSNKRGSNVLDGGCYYYDVYETKDGKYMSVGALEPQFFELFKQHIGLPELSQFVTTEEEQQRSKSAVQKAFLQKTQAEWSHIFEDIDACVYPILEWENAWRHSHNAERKTFQTIDDVLVPNPAPRLSRTPGHVRTNLNAKNAASNGISFLVEELKLTKNDLNDLANAGALQLPKKEAKL